MPTGGPLNSAESATDKMSSRDEFLLLLKQNALMILTLCGVILGFGLGFGLRRYELSDTGLMWLGNIVFFFFIYMNNVAKRFLTITCL